MTHSRKTSQMLGLATLAALGLAAAPAAHAQISGFSNSSYTLNNSTAGPAASINNGTNPATSSLQITTAAGNEANSAWYNTLQNTSAFTASWTWTPTLNGTAADGYSFAVQNAGLSALGGGGGSIGYGGANSNTGTNVNVNSSFAIGFEYYSYANVNIEEGIKGGLSSTTDTGLSFSSPITINLTYNGAAATVLMTQGANSFTETYSADVGRATGSSTGYVGFTGGTGGSNIGQVINNFSYASMAPTATAPDPTPGYVTIAPQSTDTVQAVNGSGTVPAGGASPVGEGVANIDDNNYGTKYLNFTQAGSGLIITKTTAVTAKGLALTSANDSPERDPSSFTILGSNNGVSFTQIGGQVTVPTFTSRGQTQYFYFTNSTAYTSYEVLFPTLSGMSGGVPTTPNSMQIAEVSLLAAAPEPGEIAGMLMGGLGLLGLIARKRRVNA